MKCGLSELARLFPPSRWVSSVALRWGNLSKALLHQEVVNAEGCIQMTLPGATCVTTEALHLRRMQLAPSHLAITQDFPHQDACLAGTKPWVLPQHQQTRHDGAFCKPAATRIWGSFASHTSSIFALFPAPPHPLHPRRSCNSGRCTACPLF